MLVTKRFQPKKSSSSKIHALLGLITSLFALVGLGSQHEGKMASLSQPIKQVDDGTNTDTRIEIQALKGLRQATPLLELQRIRRSIDERILFEDINMKVYAGDLVFVKGPSGSGKSQFVRIIAGLTPMDSNDASSMSLKGISWKQHQHTMGHNTPAHWRRQIRYVPQDKVLIPGTPREFVHRIASLHSWKQQRQSCHVKQVDCPPTADGMTVAMEEMLSQWGLQPVNTFLDKEWARLSGGEAQRVILAIAVASRPRMLIVDESTSALDMESKQAVEQSIVNELIRFRQQDNAQESNGMGILWISHDNQQPGRMEDLLLRKDRIEIPHVFSA